MKDKFGLIPSNEEQFDDSYQTLRNDAKQGMKWTYIYTTSALQTKSQNLKLQLSSQRS